MSNEVQLNIKEMISNFSTKEGNTLTEIDFDSLDIVELEMEIEDYYGIEFTAEESEKYFSIDTPVPVADIIKLVDEKTK